VSDAAAGAGTADAGSEMSAVTDGSTTGSGTAWSSVEFSSGRGRPAGRAAPSTQSFPNADFAGFSTVDSSATASTASPASPAASAAAPGATSVSEGAGATVNASTSTRPSYRGWERAVPATSVAPLASTGRGVAPSYAHSARPGPAAGYDIALERTGSLDHNDTRSAGGRADEAAAVNRDLSAPVQDGRGLGVGARSSVRDDPHALRALAHDLLRSLPDQHIMEFLNRHRPNSTPLVPGDHMPASSPALSRLSSDAVPHTVSVRADYVPPSQLMRQPGDIIQSLQGSTSLAGSPLYSQPPIDQAQSPQLTHMSSAYSRLHHSAFAAAHVDPTSASASASTDTDADAVDCGARARAGAHSSARADSDEPTCAPLTTAQGAGQTSSTDRRADAGDDVVKSAQPHTDHQRQHQPHPSVKQYDLRSYGATLYRASSQAQPTGQVAAAQPHVDAAIHHTPVTKVPQARDWNSGQHCAL